MQEQNQKTDSNACIDLQKLHGIISRLNRLKNDRDHYIKASDIEAIFCSLDTEVAVQPRDLSRINGDLVLPARASDKSPESQALEELLLLLSLCYMTIGKNNEVPALYSVLVVIRILLGHLMNAGIYSRHDLATLEAKFEEIDRIIEQGEETYSPMWIDFFKFQLENCRQSLVTVTRNLDGLSHYLDPVYEKLVSLIRQITAVGSRPKVVFSEIKELQDKISEVESTRVNGSFLAPDGSIPKGQEFVNELLGKCKFIADSIVNKSLQVDPVFHEIHGQLVGIKGRLEQLQLTQVWSRETDLFDLLQHLRLIDSHRVNDRFVDPNDSNISPEDGQKFLLYLLRKSYALIYELLYTSKPISESLQPIFNQLSTLKKCLLEVQRSGGISSPRELFPFSIKLASIDNLRKDGKFYVGNEIVSF
ncbi:hypothetical protein TWF694_002771 [Orbilia ellipsospora]|uniref:Uncharacterized protein n=2 Tax=Orbilia ellipsospora TaxID=2528407 RepID=A0AAV9X250_9PEZI